MSLAFLKSILSRSARSLSGVGVIVGTLFFAAALTPTLVPRTFLTQGALGGVCFAIGYGLGVAWRWLWQYLEIPEPQARLRMATNAAVSLACLAVAATFLWRSAGWQNSIRDAMSLPHVESGHPFKVLAVALATFALALVVARTFAAIAGFAARLLKRYVPRRLAVVTGVALAAGLAWVLASDVVLRSAFSRLDASYARYDALFEPERPKPTDSRKTGGPTSLVAWGELGRAGREFITDGPRAAEIAAHAGRPAAEPIRVYVGLGAAADPEARARLALEELKRVGGFDRPVLIVVTPTGTGWVDPAAMDAAEYLTLGNVASVAVQYSYLSSPLSLLTQPEYGAETARALFLAIYDHWTTLPKDSRPKLYLHGLSLGAMNSQRSAGLFEIFADPINGALWSGPPFESQIWRSVTDARQPGTPEWLPVFRDSSLVRFMNQNGPVVPPETPWGPMRVVYLQYASDPIVFFDYRDAYRQPGWMATPRGPDVSADLTWYPVVTMLQLALDMAVAATTPIGHGHVYAPEHYVDAWSAVLGETGWSPDALAALKRHLAERARAQTPERGG